MSAVRASRRSWAGPVLATAVLILASPVPGRALVPDTGVAATPAPNVGSPGQASPEALFGPGEFSGDTIPSAAEVVRLLSSQDSRDLGLEAIVLRATSLPTDRATLWIQLLATAERTGVEAGGLAARAVARADERDPPGGVALLLESLGGELPERDQSALLALATHLLAERDPARAAELRRQLIQEWPEALEVPEAQVELARHLLDQGSEAARFEARETLEALLLRRPSHPLAPEARRLRQAALSPGS